MLFHTFQLIEFVYRCCCSIGEREGVRTSGVWRVVYCGAAVLAAAARPGCSPRTRRPLSTQPVASHSGELLDDRAIPSISLYLSPADPLNHTYIFSFIHVLVLVLHFTFRQHRSNFSFFFNFYLSFEILLLGSVVLLPHWAFVLD